MFYMFVLFIGPEGQHPVRPMRFSTVSAWRIQEASLWLMLGSPSSLLFLLSRESFSLGDGVLMLSMALLPTPLAQAGLMVQCALYEFP